MFYKLNENNEIEKTGSMEMKPLFKEDVGKYLISTVFLSMDHGKGFNTILSNDGEYKPILFESMVFTRDKRDKYKNYTVRYDSYDKARLGHKTLVRAFRKRIEKIK